MTESELYSNSIKEAFFLSVKKFVLDKIFSSVPLLGSWFFSPIVTMIVSKIVGYLAEEGRLLIYFKYIDMRVSVQASNYGEAAKKYYEALQKGDENEIKKMELELDKTFDAFVKWSIG